MLAAHVGNVGQFRNAGNQFIDAQLGGLVGRAVGGTGAGTSNGAAGGEDHDVGQLLLVFGFLGVNGGGQEQQKGQGPRSEGGKRSFHCCSLLLVALAV
ncbi:hypothetical protein D3C77_593880 [compost metagenome]